MIKRVGDLAGAKVMAAFAGLSLAAAACGGETGGAKPEAKPSASAAGAAATPAPTGAPADAAKPTTATPPADKAVTAPEQQSYSMDGIKTIPDNCQSAHVILANAPSTVGADYPWTWSKQALLANQQFKLVSEATAPGQVSFAAHQADASMAEAWVLLATCGDGSTCNRLASMYKAVVKSSNPTVFCGPVPANLGSPKKQVDLLAGGPEANVPKAGDVIGMCARIGACTVATKPDTAEDVGIQCQKAPSSFKTDCASKYPCSEVMACLGQ